MTVTVHTQKSANCSCSFQPQTASNPKTDFFRIVTIHNDQRSSYPLLLVCHTGLTTVVRVMTFMQWHLPLKVKGHVPSNQSPLEASERVNKSPQSFYRNFWEGRGCGPIHPALYHALLTRACIADDRSNCQKEICSCDRGASDTLRVEFSCRFERPCRLRGWSEGKCESAE